MTPVAVLYLLPWVLGLAIGMRFPRYALKILTVALAAAIAVFVALVVVAQGNQALGLIWLSSSLLAAGVSGPALFKSALGKLLFSFLFAVAFVAVTLALALLTGFCIIFGSCI